MKNLNLVRYDASYLDRWNDFVRESANGTFLLDRGFMEYHAERFTDHSLLIYSGVTLIAVLPGHESEGVFYSHQGLTYGGIIKAQSLRLPDVLQVIAAVLRYLYDEGFTSMNVKSVPEFFHRIASQEWAYAMFICQGRLYRRDPWSVLDNRNPYSPTKARMRDVLRGRENGLAVREVQDFDTFWNEVLIPRLGHRHKASPVHSLEEIRLLAGRFPTNIRQFNVYEGHKILGGATVFETPLVAHVQYIAGVDGQNRTGALDYLFDVLIAEVFPDKAYFDFGTSAENGGRKLNHGLLFWKESFGARTVCQDFYEVNTANYHLLDSVLS